MDIIEQSHYPEDIDLYVYETGPWRIAEKSQYIKFKPKRGYISYYSCYEFRFLDSLIFQDNIFMYDEKMSWDAYYPFQHDEANRMNINVGVYFR